MQLFNLGNDVTVMWFQLTNINVAINDLIKLFYSTNINIAFNDINQFEDCSVNTKENNDGNVDTKVGYNNIYTEVNYDYNMIKAENDVSNVNAEVDDVCYVNAVVTND